MKNFLTVASIAMLSTVVNAENSVLVQQTDSSAVLEKGDAISEMIVAKKDANNFDLWEILDINKDGSISKIEAAYSKEVFENWDKLDLNNDEKLDTKEFAQHVSQFTDQ